MVLPLIILAGVPFIMVLGNSMLIPIFPQMEKAMNLTPFQVSLFITLFSVPAGLLIPFAGILSDHIGRKTVMVPALIIYGTGGLVAGTAAALLSQPYPVLLAGRILQGIGAGGTYQLAMALAGDVFTTEERTKVLGYLESANGFGKVCSPLLGAALALLVWYAPFFAYGLLALPIAFLVLFLVKEPEGRSRKQTAAAYLQSLKKIYQSKAAPLLACYAAGAIGLFLLFGLLSFFSDELEAKYHITGFAKGGVLAIPVGTMAAASFLGGLLLQGQRQLLKPVILAGLALTSLGLAVFAFDLSAPAAIAISALIALGIGTLLPPLNTLITSSASTNERGLVTCLYGTVRFFGVAIGPPAFALAGEIHRLLLFLGAAGLAAAGIAIAAIWVNTSTMLNNTGSAGGA